MPTANPDEPFLHPHSPPTMTSPLTRSTGTAGLRLFGLSLRACPETPRGRVADDFGQSARRGRARIFMRSLNSPATPPRAKIGATPRALAIFVDSGVGSAVKARCGDSPVSPPGIRRKWPIARPLRVFKHALSVGGCRRCVCRSCKDMKFYPGLNHLSAMGDAGAE